MPVASAVAGVHRDRLLLASNAQWPEIQPLMSRGQIVSTDFPLLSDRQTHNSNLNITFRLGFELHIHVFCSSIIGVSTVKHTQYVHVSSILNPIG